MIFGQQRTANPTTTAAALGIAAQRPTGIDAMTQHTRTTAARISLPSLFIGMSSSNLYRIAQTATAIPALGAAQNEAQRQK